VSAEIIGWRRYLPLESLVVGRASAPDLEVRQAAASALGALGTATAAEAVVPLLGDEGCKRIARQALVAAEDVGFIAALPALRDPPTAKPVRGELPRPAAPTSRLSLTATSRSPPVSPRASRRARRSWSRHTDRTSRTSAPGLAYVERPGTSSGEQQR